MHRYFPTLLIFGIGLLVALFSSINIQLASAERPADDLPPETKQALNKTIGQAVNGLVVFGANTSLGSGNFTFDHEGKDSKLSVMRVSGSYSFGCDDDTTVAPFISGTAGSVKLTEYIPPAEGTGTEDFSTLYTFTVGAGGGADIRLGSSFIFTPAFELSYNKTSNNYDFNNTFSQQYLAVFDKDVFNFDIETLTYLPSVNLRYEGNLNTVRIIPSITYSQLFIDSIWSSSSIYSVHAASGILNSKLASEIPVADLIGTSDLYIAPHYALTGLYRDARDGFGFTTINEFGLDVFSEQENILYLFSRVGLGFTYYFADNFNGWRLGLESSF